MTQGFDLGAQGSRANCLCSHSVNLLTHESLFVSGQSTSFCGDAGKRRRRKAPARIGAIWCMASARLSDSPTRLRILVNWHAGLQPCGRRGAGVPDAVPYMLLGMPSPDLLLRWDAGRWADALDPRHLSDVPSLHQGDLRGSRLGSIQATVKVSGQVSFLEIRRSAFITISRC